MDHLFQGLLHAARLIASGDRGVIEIAWLSLEVSALATLLALVAGVPFGVWIGLKSFPGRNLIVSLVNTGDWFAVPGSTGTNRVFVPLDPAKANVFFRMLKP